MTAISIVLDECAWLPSGDAVNSAEDLMTALQPSLLTTSGPLLLTSSPAASSGLVYEIFRRHYGPDGDPGCIVVQTGTRTLNPKAKQSVIDKAYASDPETASAEYGGEFRVPISNYLSREVVDRCIAKGVKERSPQPQVSYLAYVDCASGEGKDSMACVVGHKSRDRDRDIVVIDEIIEARPPFNLHDAITHLAVRLRKWNITSVMGDRYGKPLISFFAKAGLTYLTTPIDTSDVYLHCLPQWTSRSVLMLDHHSRAIDQLVNLRRVSENNREYVKHAKNAHDDLATAICGLIYRLTPLQQVAGTGYPITVVQPVAYPGESSEADDTMRAWRASHGDAYRVANQPGSIHHGVRVKVASGRGWLPV